MLAGSFRLHLLRRPLGYPEPARRRSMFRRRWRRGTRQRSVDAQLVQSRLRNAKVVGQLVDHRDPDLMLQLGRIREIL